MSKSEMFMEWGFGAMSFAIAAALMLFVIAGCNKLTEPETPPAKEFPYTHDIGDVRLGFKTDQHRKEFIRWSKEWGYPCDNLSHFQED